MAFPTNANQVQAFAGAMYGIQIGSVTLAQVNSDIAAVGSLTSALNSYYAYSFGGVATPTVAATVAANLGLTGAALTEGIAYITAQLNAAAPGARGAVIASTLNLFAGMASDTTFGAAATAWNTKVAAAAVYTGTTDVAIGTVVASTAAAFTLTTGTNNFIGTAADDSFDAGLSTSSLQTLNSGDQLDGGAGNDELYAIVTASVTPSTIKNLESIYLTNTSTTAVATVDFSNATGISKIVNQSSTFGTTISGIANTVAVTVRDTSFANQTVTYNNVTGSADSATIDLSNVSSNATLVVAGVETLTLNSTGTSTNVLAGTTTDATKTLNVTGSIGLTLGTLGSTVLALDSSANTFVGAGVSATFAGVTATTVTGGVGNDTFVLGSSSGADSVTAGAGNDSVTFSANFTTADTVDGGDGTTDTLVIRTTTDAVTASASTPTTYRVTNVETITVGGASLTGLAAGGSITPANISATATTLNIAPTGLTTAIDVLVGAGTVVGPAGAFTLGLGGSAAGNTALMIGALTVTDTGSLTTDSIILKNNAATGSGTANFNVYNGQAITSTGYETVTINTGTVSGVQNTVGIVTITGDIGGTSAETLNITGVNSLQMVGANVVDIIDASALTAAGTGTTAATAAFAMTAAGSATTITGSAGIDILFSSASSSSVNGGAGTDSITSGAGNDTILGGDGADTIIGAAGNDNIDGGAGNDRIEMTGLTANDTVAGGADTDTLAITAAYTDGAALASAVSGFEVLELAPNAIQAVVMSNFINNSTFTRVDFGDSNDGATGITLTNAPALVTDIRFISGAAGDTFSFDRLIDNSANSVTISSRAALNGGNAVTAFTDADSETINVSGSSSANDLTITTLTVTDLTTLNITGDADILLASIAGATKLATVNASTSTGVVTIDGSTSVVSTTATAGSGVFTYTGGFLADSITGGNAADFLAGGAGNDTIVGGLEADSITGGAGADSMTGGSGIDRFTVASGSSSVLTASSFVAPAAVAAGDTITFGSGIDVITDFTSGTDILNTGATAGAVTSLIGANSGALTATANYYASGTYIASTGQFIIAANAAGADTLIIDAQSSTAVLTTNTSMVVLIGVVSSSLVTNVANDFA